MKYSIIIAFLSFATLTNCSLEGDNEIKDQVYKTYWHLTNVSGGIAGVDNDFNLNEIIWTFNEDTDQLKINNTNTAEIEDGLDTGTYTYSVTIVEVEGEDDKSFLVIDSNEFGKFTFNETELVIDQNITTTGTGADGFIYIFKRVVIIEDVE
ncbi:hypothetical protein EV196_11620 [Mariniflexile fucanivorans]|uniref:Lipocalin-like protein n=1 Tax=Mariniflexile fucanivorans TaxID=264023 RepID=A0A4R1R8Y9_9FLAO|nr:hypothetical protein [Mariniflexile fucanivorans]TCL62145.1 hypothetical protein EV196_11620 [Mariniflexile fucanivorans]